VLGAVNQQDSCSSHSSQLKLAEVQAPPFPLSSDRVESLRNVAQQYRFDDETKGCTGNEERRHDTVVR